MTATANTKQALAPGQRKPFPVPGTSAVVYVQRGDVQGYRVWVELGSVVEGWDYTFTTHAQASAEFKRAARAFHTHKTDTGIEAARNALAIELAQQHSRSRRRMHNPTRIAAIEAELEALESFGDRALAARLTADLTTFLAA